MQALTEKNSCLARVFPSREDHSVIVTVTLVFVRLPNHVALR